MILTKSTPFSKEEIEKLKEEYDVYIKTVIDIDKKICTAGMNMHYEGEDVLLQEGSHQNTIWGGGIDTQTKEIDYNSFINIRPADNNPKNDIQDPHIRARYDELTRYFFAELFK